MGALTLEDIDARLRDHNEQQLRAYVATVNLRHDLRRIPLKKGEKIRMRFVYFSEYYWPSWDSLYATCRADERMDVDVVYLDAKHVVLPEFPSPANAENFLQKRSIAYTRYDDYDPYADRPHIVVYQSPYNTLYLHFAKLKANHIKEAGIRPVYISYGIEYDRPKKRPESPEAHLNMLHYRQYVQLFAWKIFVMHPDIRTGFYTHCLAGGSHVIAQGHPRFDAYAAGRLPRLPESLLRKAAGRPILVWQAHHFVNDESCEPSRTYSPSFAETEKMFSLLCGQSRVFIAATLHPLFVVDALNSGQATQADVDRLKSLIRESPNMALYDGDYQSLLAGADAFVTEKSSLMLEMAFLDKPTLFLQDIEVAFKPFAQDIASSFYRGKGLDDVQRFLRVVTGEAPDTAAEDRKRVKAAYFAECDGHIGERIKEHLIQSLRAEQEEQREGCRA